MDIPQPRWNSWDLDPEPNVPTPGDLALADELKRRLQAKLLGRAADDDALGERPLP